MHHKAKHQTERVNETAKVVRTDADLQQLHPPKPGTPAQQTAQFIEHVQHHFCGGQRERVPDFLTRAMLQLAFECPDHPAIRALTGRAPATAPPPPAEQPALFG